MNSFVDKKISTDCNMDLMNNKLCNDFKKFIQSLLKDKGEGEEIEMGRVVTTSPNLQIYISSDKKDLILKHKWNFWVFGSKGSRRYEIHNKTSEITVKEFLTLVNIREFTNKNQIELKSLITDFSEDEVDPWISLLKSHLTSLIFSYR